MNKTNCKLNRWWKTPIDTHLAELMPGPVEHPIHELDLRVDGLKWLQEFMHVGAIRKHERLAAVRYFLWHFEKRMQQKKGENND